MTRPSKAQVSQKRALRLDDFERGLRELLQDDDVAVDCVVSNLAKKIVRELSITPDGATELITRARAAFIGRARESPSPWKILFLFFKWITY